MDLKLYYQKMREAKARITDEFPVMMSQETDDGGKPGILTEVTREIAARMLVEGTARVAGAAEAVAFRERQEEALRAVEQAIAATKVQLTVVPTNELTRLRGAARAAKE